MIDYFKEINRSLTALIAGIIGGSLLVVAMYFTAVAFGAPNLRFILISFVALYFALLITQVLHLYFYKLLDREAYNEIGNKIFQFAIFNILLLIFAFPFLFIVKSSSPNLYQVFMLGILFFSQIGSTFIRERSDSRRFIPNLIGTFFAVLLTSYIASIAFGMTELSLVWKVSLVGIVLPLSMSVSSIFELIGALVVKILSPTPEQQSETISS